MYGFCKSLFYKSHFYKQHGAFGRFLLFPIGLLICVASAVDAAESVEKISSDYASNGEAAQTVLIDDSARALFVSSGLYELIEQIPLSTASSFELALTVDRLPDIFSDIEPEYIRRVVHDAFKFETFDKYMVREFRNGMSDDARTEMLDWYASNLGARVRQAELDNSLLSEQQRFEDYQTYLLRYPASSERTQLIHNLDETMQSTESAVDMMINIQIAFNLSLTRFMPEEQRLSRTEILEMANEDKPAWLAQYRQQTEEVLLFTYQDLDDEDLKQLDSTLASESGQAFVISINEGIKKGMFAASLDLGDGLGALLKDQSQSPGI